MEPHTASPAAIRQRLALGFLTLVGVFLLYALSSGPVLALVRRSMELESPITAAAAEREVVAFKIYLPLRSVVLWAGLAKPYVGYVNWWYRHILPSGGAWMHEY